MKNLFLYLMVVLCTVAAASASVLNQDVRDVQVRVKRSNPWDFFRKTPKDKKKKKKKKKSKKTTAKPTTIPTTLPTTIPSTPVPTTPVGKGRIPRHILRKIIHMNRTELEQYLGITKEMMMKIQATVSKDPPPPKQTRDAEAVAQSGNPGLANCNCMPTETRVFMDNPQSHLGVHIPNNCIKTYQCGGGCVVPEYQECKPLEKDIHIITHSRLFYQYDGRSEIKFQNVEYHRKCSCQCKKRDCPPRMYFDHRSSCDCECKPEYSKKKLSCSGSFVFDEDSCTCKCLYRYQHCRHPKQEWDKRSCQCRCSSYFNSVCKRRGQIMDPNSCMCGCPRGQVMKKNKCSVIAMSNGK